MARNKKRTRPIIINAPKHYNPGKGRPMEELAYISQKEKKRLLGSTDHKAEMTKHGILSFADDSASSMGVSRGDPSQGTTGSSGSGAARGNESGGVGAQSGGSKASSGGGTTSGGSKASGAAGAGGGPGD